MLETESETSFRRTCCDTNEYYAPDPLYPEHRPEYTIRLNFHFMNSTDGANNMPVEEQEAWVRGLVWVMNKSLNENMKMWLPQGNNTPALPIPFRYTMVEDPTTYSGLAIYNHVDDELCFFVKQGKHRNNTDMRVINKYRIDHDSVLNVFLMPHPPDSVKSRTYRADASGIALGTSVKVGGQWIKKPDHWGVRGIFHHEIAHVLGLSHTWNTNDGCDDTPRNPNCYNHSDKPPCDTEASNNIMDYNAHQAAWSPCQLGKIVRNFSRYNSRQRNIVEPIWCEWKADKQIRISEDVTWHSARDLQGDVIIESGARLTIKCRTSLPKNGRIVIEPDAELHLDNGELHNSCGDQWAGIEVQQYGKQIGKIRLSGNASIAHTPGLDTEASSKQ